MHRTDVLRAKAIKHGKLTAIQNHFSVTSWLINKTVFCCCTYSQNSEDTSTFKSQPQGIYINLEGDHVAVTLYACYVCRSTQILSVFRSICQRSSVRRTFQHCSPYNRFAVRRMALPAKATALDVEAAPVVAKDLRTLEVSVLHLPRHKRTDPTSRFLKNIDLQDLRPRGSIHVSMKSALQTIWYLYTVLLRQLQRLTNPTMWMHKCRI